MESLHNNKELFHDILLAVREDTGIHPAIIEKDYYVTLLLKKIVEKNPDIIFKGGTSLSKCHKIINRFSEDIDIGVNADKATEVMRRNLKYDILSAVEDLGFAVDNAEHIYSRTYFNRYQIEYPNTESVSYIKPFLYVETATFMKPFPFEVKEADTYIYRFLKEKGMKDLIEQYGLHPFDVKVQTLDRTFIDKLFALGDYYLTEKTNGYSRHLYDLYKIMPKIDFGEDFYKLFDEVREIRSKDRNCPSAKGGQNLKEILIKIYEEDYFEKDYKGVTMGLLFDEVSYDDVKPNLNKIIGKIK
ncbi:MAG: nucleotidyl transferase AbiEii/AbiGii toxin family protein [Ruminococcus sp.]|nr:nucleotidyl transferase AbiEii/AbiGii toxin family protein [Ruminococcus sp.]